MEDLEKSNGNRETLRRLIIKVREMQNTIKSSKKSNRNSKTP